MGACVFFWPVGKKGLTFEEGQTIAEKMKKKKTQTKATAGADAKTKHCPIKEGLRNKVWNVLTSLWVFLGYFPPQIFVPPASTALPFDRQINPSVHPVCRRRGTKGPAPLIRHIKDPRGGTTHTLEAAARLHSPVRVCTHACMQRQCLSAFQRRGHEEPLARTSCAD